jgi:hypothetical protein
LHKCVPLPFPAMLRLVTGRTRVGNQPAFTVIHTECHSQLCSRCVFQPQVAWAGSTHDIRSYGLWATQAYRQENLALLAPISRMRLHEATDQAVCLSLQTLTFTGVSIKSNKVSCCQGLLSHEASALDLWSLNFSWLRIPVQTPAKHQAPAYGIHAYTVRSHLDLSRP